MKPKSSYLVTLKLAEIDPFSWDVAANIYAVSQVEREQFLRAEIEKQRPGLLQGIDDWVASTGVRVSDVKLVVEPTSISPILYVLFSEISFVREQDATLFRLAWTV